MVRLGLLDNTSIGKVINQKLIYLKTVKSYCSTCSYSVYQVWIALNGNFRSSQTWKFYQSDNILVSFISVECKSAKPIEPKRAKSLKLTTNLEMPFSFLFLLWFSRYFHWSKCYLKWLKRSCEILRGLFPWHGPLQTWQEYKHSGNWRVESFLYKQSGPYFLR